MGSSGKASGSFDAVSLEPTTLWKVGSPPEFPKLLWGLLKQKLRKASSFLFRAGGFPWIDKFAPLHGKSH